MVRIYALKIDEIPDYNEAKDLFNLMPKYRQEKIRKMRFEKDKKLSFGAGLLTSYAFIKNGAKGDVSFINKGKPVAADLYFNISHSEDYVICAISDKNVGCDIEKVTEYNEKIAMRFFSKEEFEYLSNISEKRQAFEFFRIWTIKESYIKMTGEGVSVGLDTFSVRFNNGDELKTDAQIFRKINGDCDKNGWQNQNCYVHEYSVPGYCVSVCSEENLFDKNIQCLKYYELCDTIV